MTDPDKVARWMRQAAEADQRGKHDHAMYWRWRAAGVTKEEAKRRSGVTDDLE
jgi:hypothetical protein